MSNYCGYYKFGFGKGNAHCENPTKSYYSNLRGSDLDSQCKLCKLQCKGIWPSQLPKVDFTEESVDVIDKNGKVLN